QMPTRSRRIQISTTPSILKSRFDVTHGRGGGAAHDPGFAVGSRLIGGYLTGSRSQARGAL
ncbi:hypothetical protein, partial [Microlunatus aurantiacus]|uniref:hypothetical protein n=1 Tax=Microlunatus aurantiacus TaxID=446786 RepID=UPI0031DDC41D